MVYGRGSRRWIAAGVGLVEEHAARYLGSEYSNLSVFVILLLVLMIRPTGLFGKVQERMV